MELYAIPALITVSTILIFCLMVAGQLTSWLHWLISLVVVTCVYIFHFSDGIN